MKSAASSRAAPASAASHHTSTRVDQSDQAVVKSPSVEVVSSARVVTSPSIQQASQSQVAEEIAPGSPTVIADQPSALDDDAASLAAASPVRAENVDNDDAPHA